MDLKALSGLKKDDKKDDNPSSVQGTVENPEQFTKDVKEAAVVTKEALEKHLEDFDASALKVAEALGGRNIEDVPLDDPYWGAVNSHRLAHNK